MSAKEPDISSDVPVPETVTPPADCAESDPEATLKVTVTVPDPASASAKEMPVIAVAVSSEILTTAGAETVGASLTAVICSAVVSAAVCAPPLPEFPPSVMLVVRITLPVAFAAGVKVTLAAAMNALISATVPVSVRPVPFGLR